MHRVLGSVQRVLRELCGAGHQRSSRTLAKLELQGLILSRSLTASSHDSARLDSNDSDYKAVTRTRRLKSAGRFFSLNEDKRQAMILRRAMATAAKRVPIPKNGVDYRGKVVLAPMVRSGECPSRLLALRYGADLVWGPETVDKALIGCTRQINERTGTVDFCRTPTNLLRNPETAADAKESVIFRLHPEREGKRFIFQIGSANPDTAVEAAKLIAGDVAGIDLNSGCPKPFSTSGGMGAALLKTPDKLCSILRALVKEVGEPNEIGISVKIRLLETPELTGTLVRRLVQTGITGLTIHCRTTPMRPREPAIRDQLRMIGDICREAGVACLMNGDVGSRAAALELAKDFGVDGGMIATAAETNPSIFRPETEGGKEDWLTVVEEYISLCMLVENKWGNTKYLLGQMMPGKTWQHKSIHSTKSYTDLISLMGWNERFGEAAKRADQVLEIGAFEKPKVPKSKKKAAQQSVITQPQITVAKDNRGMKRTAEQAALSTPSDRLAPGFDTSTHGNLATAAI